MTAMVESTNSFPARKVLQKRTNAVIQPVNRKEYRYLATRVWFVFVMGITWEPTATFHANRMLKVNVLTNPT